MRHLWAGRAQTKHLPTAVSLKARSHISVAKVELHLWYGNGSVRLPSFTIRVQVLLDGHKPTPFKNLKPFFDAEIVNGPDIETT
jgi:hypothetical protein